MSSIVRNRSLRRAGEEEKEDDSSNGEKCGSLMEYPPEGLKSSSTDISYPRKFLFVAKIALALVLASALCHRAVIFTRRCIIWQPAPIVHVQRACPAPPYETLTSTRNGTTTEESHASTKSPKICLTTLTDTKKRAPMQRIFGWRNYDGILDLTWKNKEDYANKHGYKLFDESAMVDPSRPPAWSKPLAAKRLLLQEDCDWVFWLDADTVIMNSEIRVEEFIPADESKHFVVAPDEHRVRTYNSGAWLIRKHAWSTNFLDEWFAQKQHVHLVGRVKSGDQCALNDYLEQTKQMDPQNHGLVSHQCNFNSFILTIPPILYKWQTNVEREEFFYHKGHFLAHAAGIDNKAAVLTTMLEMAE